MHRFVTRYREVMFPLLGATASSLLVAVVWFALQAMPQSSQTVHVDMPLYHSIEDLASASDLVVQGTIGRVVGREVDYGTADPAQKQGEGIPLVFHAVKVTDTLQGTHHDIITVGVPDAERLDLSGYAVPLRQNQKVLLFLSKETAASAPGITREDDFLYSTVSLANGVFDRQADNAFVPRMAYLFSQDTYRFDEVREKTRR